MTLATSRIVIQGETPYAHERDAIELAIAELPNHDPYHLWALVDLLDGAEGRLYEIDLLVMGYGALYLVEVKSGPGRYTGDSVDWWRTPAGEGERSSYMDAPLRLTNLKAKVLKSRLRAKMQDPKRAPWIEPLVFLSHPDVELCLEPDGLARVVTRKTFLRAITHHEFPGSPPGWQARRIDQPAAKDIAQALKALGLRPRKGQSLVGPYELGAVLAEGPGFQDRLAQHTATKSIRCRARTYLLPEQTSVERRQQLRRAADREAQLLHEVREHPSVLRATGYFVDAPLGPTVVFDDFENGVPLGAFLRQSPELPLCDRVAILEQVGRVLAHCHRKGVVHGALSPEAVLVRRHPETGAPEVRLFNFQLGEGVQISATTHWSALAAEPWELYRAPELREDPSARSTASDVYSLGALAHFVLTGRPPADSLVELIVRLTRDQRLDPRAVSSTLSEGLAELVCESTLVKPVYRLDSADFWTDALLDCATAPDELPVEVAVDPLEARPGQILAGKLVVKGVLGHGATSRVLLVERESDGHGQKYALKIAISPDQDERLEREAEVLAKLEHPRIVRLVELLRVGTRRCLLLSLAGSETLFQYLKREGSLSLDLGSRYGEDLLQTLEHLEEEQVMHRDIKPANLGVGSAQKKGLHLALFDFTLALAPPTDLELGTAIYRDPFVELRGAWDYAAERWSAAVTLHEMLTGTRPSFGEAGRSALDADAKLVLAAERFDPSVRDKLVRFFERALDRDADKRFESAAKMRHAWNLCFEQADAPVTQSASGTAAEASSATARATVISASGDEVLPPEAPAAAMTDEALARLEPETPIEALPLSPRARNALDRSGVLQANELLSLKDNVISAIRGIGTKVAREILDFRARWARVHAPSASSAPEAPATRSEPKAGRSAPPPSALARQLESLLPRSNRSTRFFRALYGLEAPFSGRIDATVKEVAAHFDVTAPAIYIAQGKLRAAWAVEPLLAPARESCRAIVEAAGGALILGRTADELLARLPVDRHALRELERARAAALIRMVCEIEKEEPDGLRLARLRGETPWVLAREELAPVVRALGARADKLAEREIVASPGEVERVLVEEAQGTELASLGADRLSLLAAAASAAAARSPRLELYPRGMAPPRTLALSSVVLVSHLTPAQIRERVASRYPDAAPLPDRPELDALLEAHGLRFNEVSGRYARAGDQPGSSLHTTLSSLTRLPASLRTGFALPEPRTIAKREFDERIRNAIERRSLVVLGAMADRAEHAALALAERFSLERVSLDAELIVELKTQMARLFIPNDQVVHDADLDGPAGKAWPNLLRLAEAAADALAKRILPPGKPLLLAEPGLVARYRLGAFLRQVVQASARDEAAAIFLLVPSHDTGGIPKVNGELAIPGVLPSQALWIPRAWLAAHDAESAA